MEEISKLKEELLLLDGVTDDFSRRMLIAAKLSTFMVGIGYDPPIVVGGTAVSVYSNGQYATVDIDFISSSEIKTREVLTLLGYEKRGKDFYHGGLKSLIEFPSRNFLENPSKITKFQVPNSEDFIYLIGIDDLILDRIGSFVATGDQKSREWSIVLMLLYYKELDWPYLHKTSNNRMFLKQFQKIQREAKYLIRNNELSATKQLDLFN